MWQPLSYEDRLLARYLDAQPGELFLEVPVGRNEDRSTARWVDGVLVPGDETRVHARGAYDISSFSRKISGETVHLIEAKAQLQSHVIGQVMVGRQLLLRDFGPAEVTPVVVCERDSLDMSWYCDQEGIKVEAFPDIDRGGSTMAGGCAYQESADIRRLPDLPRRRAFQSGWTDAINGQLYETSRSYRTHQNMGNLFGWIYGDQPKEFRESTWLRYLKYAGKDEWESSHL